MSDEWVIAFKRGYFVFDCILYIPDKNSIGGKYSMRQSELNNLKQIIKDML